jgi:hypothetical protein
VGQLDLELADLLPSDRATRFEDRFTLPDDLAAGRYDLFLVIRDTTGYRDPLALAIHGRQADGSYPLGEVTVERAGEPQSPAQQAVMYRMLLPIIGQPIP